MAAAVCRRCRRPVGTDPTTCDYCSLSDPDGIADRPSRESRNPLWRFRYYLGAAASVVVVGLAAGAWAIAGDDVLPPACNDPKVLGGVSEVIHDNAVFELPPSTAARFPLPTFKNLDRAEASGPSRSATRACRASLVLALDDVTTGIVERLAANPPAALPPAIRTLIAETWHAAKRRMEIPVGYQITMGTSGGTPTPELTVEESSAAAIRDLIGLIARSTP